MKLENVGRLPIPRRLSEEANQYNPKRRLDDWETNVREVEFNNLKGLLARGYMDWHDDADCTNYCALWIIKNSFGAWVETRGEPLLPQPRGTLMLLNVAQEHRLMVKNEERGRQGVWLAISRDYKKKPSHSQVLKDFKNDLRIYKTPCSNSARFL